jgi:hypothetical protein
MVYRGKPSAACGECRKRRSRVSHKPETHFALSSTSFEQNVATTIVFYAAHDLNALITSTCGLIDTSQCDQVVPACGQCIKAHRICPGYRNAVDLMFHDESKQIAHRNKTRPLQSTEKQESASAITDKRALVSLAEATPVKLTDFVLYQPLDDLGVNFFMSTYVGDDPAVSQLHYLPKFYATIGHSNPGLQQGIIAAGLAGYAKIAQQRDVSDAATRRYVAAIQSINATLSDPKTAMQESTLLAILLAAMFEVLIVPRLSDLQNCTKHLDGAVAVASLMLKRNKPTEVTRKLITTLTHCVIINSWISHVPLPRDFAHVKSQLGDSTEFTSVHSRFLDVVVDLVQFRQALQANAFDHPTSIINQALIIDRKLEKFANDMPPISRYQSYRVPLQMAQQLAYNGYYHGISPTAVNFLEPGQLTRSISIYPAIYRSSLE